MPKSEYRRDANPHVDILLIYNVVFLALDQLFSSMVIMGFFIHFLLHFWLCVLDWDIVSGLGFRDGFLFVSNFTNQLGLFPFLHCNVHFTWLWRFSGVLRQL